LCIFAVVARVDKVLGSSNFGNMPPRYVQANLHAYGIFSLISSATNFLHRLRNDYLFVGRNFQEQWKSEPENFTVSEATMLAGGNVGRLSGHGCAEGFLPT